MRCGFARLFLLPVTLAALPARGADVTASAPSDVAVTVYRAPNRGSGAMVLGRLGGFAVVTETRRVTLPVGESRLRFEGVVDTIVPESALVSGLPGGVIEKNSDSALISPSALLRAAVGRQLQLRRTDPVTGKVRSIRATLRSASPDGVLFETDDGIEALLCTGLAETFRLESAADGLVSRPTLSVRTRSHRAIDAVVTLTYIAERFDWSASYTAAVTPDGRTLDLAAAITLANGSTVTLPGARVQVVAGTAGRARSRRFRPREPAVIARCWPAGRTHEVPQKPEPKYELVRPWEEPDYERWVAATDAGTDSYGVGSVSGVPAEAMQAGSFGLATDRFAALGDLKLFRLPESTDVAAMQMKQVRFLARSGIAFSLAYTVRIDAGSWLSEGGQGGVVRSLRTRNDRANGLGLPLPAGGMAVTQTHDGRPMLLGQPDVGDLAENEEVALALNESPDVRWRLSIPTVPPPGLSKALRAQVQRDRSTFLRRVELRNASLQAVAVEVRVQTNAKRLPILYADQPMSIEDGETLFRMNVPANGRSNLDFVGKLTR